jgi:NAD+ synthase (glutamine-hydrolysing)
VTQPEPSITVALAQINPTVGDLAGNAGLIRERIGAARDAGADLVLFPELCLTGYPAEDLYLKRHFLDQNLRALESVASEARGIVALVGFAEPLARRSRDAGSDTPRPQIARNALAVLESGRLSAVHRKNRLPNYAVFDERRYFEPGDVATVHEVAGVPVGLTICEDMWEPGDPACAEVAAGAQLLVNASGSPYLRGKAAEREEMFAQRARDYGVPVAFCNLVGGQDELIFDGASFGIEASGEVGTQARQFEEDLVIWTPGHSQARTEEPLDAPSEVYAALVLGVRDYVTKNGFRHVVLGLSGGIDSALVAMIAADAIGAEHLACVVMPSPHSSDETQADARAIARNLGAELIEIPIEPAMDAYARMLDWEVEGDRLELGAGGVASGGELARENIQARIRGNLLMAISNQRGSLVLTTGNKSEMSVGYATLYGDMAGGLAVVKDVPKRLVYELVRHRNARAGRELVPASVIDRPPSAELKPGQRDEDSLPPYELLDRVLEAYVERDLSLEEIVADGVPADVAEEVIRLVDRAEYKRRQAPPGIRITSKAFGRDRRLPITNRFRG